jgi:plastocyanin
VVKVAAAAIALAIGLAFSANSGSATDSGLLSIKVTGHGGVYSRSTRLAVCSGSCLANYRSTASMLVVRAVPNAGWQFSHWAGGCLGTSPVCRLHVASHSHLTAVFVVSPPKTPTTTPTVPAGSVITVTAGRASNEYSFVLSSQSVPMGVVTFEVTNAGVLPHNFQVCAVPGDLTADSCVGATTPTLMGGAPALMGGGGGQTSAYLTVTFTAPGTYEYLSTIPGQAAAGMKGLLTVTG